jgi:hypothetical protein
MITDDHLFNIWFEYFFALPIESRTSVEPLQGFLKGRAPDEFDMHHRYK